MSPSFQRNSFRIIAMVGGCALTLMAGAKPPASKPSVDPLVGLEASPAKITLKGPYAEARLLVEGIAKSGTRRDMTGDAGLNIADSKIAELDDSGIVRGKHDGATVLTGTLKGRSVRIPIVVTGFAAPVPPRFLADVEPILTKAGCNMGACHGAASGKGGFKLSLLGYDPDTDFVAITRQKAAGRIAAVQPDQSLLLLKPTLKVVHRGGLRFRVGSPEYKLLRDWIAAGAPGPQAKEPAVVALETSPAVRKLAIGQTQRIRVTARYANGTTRDVTGETLFTGSDETVAKVSADGEATVTGPGEAAVVIRYQGLVGTARIISPYAAPYALPRAIGNSAGQTVDRLGMQKLADLGLPASLRCSDSDFLRRASLDVTGQMPSPDETRAFLADRDPNKRDKLIDTLLARPEYVDFWTLKWADILRCSRTFLSAKGMYAYNNWIRQSVAENRPWDQFAGDLLLAQGSVFKDGAANYYKASGSPQELAENTAQVFLGVRMQCAKCHNHPYDRWTQNQYYEMAAFFAQVGRKPGERAEEQVVYTTGKGDIANPRTGKIMMPCALDAKPVAADFTGDRRAELVKWMTAPQNPFFAHTVVNRIWRHYMGRGFVEPVDDIRPTNPASNAPLFDYLAQDFAGHGYDLKRLMRTILRSEAYQRSAVPVPGNARDTRYYAHYPFKRLGAEQMLDAISTATGVSEKFDGLPSGVHAAQLPDSGVNSYFLDLFGRPARNIVCECERSDEPNLGQVLHLMNGPDLNTRLTAKNGRIAALFEKKLADAPLVEELYLAAYSRYPTPAESRRAVTALSKAKDRRQATEDLFWALLNAKEFFFNH
jgi:hypothetical protein